MKLFFAMMARLTHLHSGHNAGYHLAGRIQHCFVSCAFAAVVISRIQPWISVGNPW
jgi:hypothetical protein